MVHGHQQFRYALEAQTKEFQDAVNSLLQDAVNSLFQDVVNSLTANTDLFLKSLREPGSLFSNHLQEIRAGPTSPQTKRMHSNVVGYKSGTEIRKVQTLEGELFHKSSPSWSPGSVHLKTDNLFEPTRTVVLRPCASKFWDLKSSVSSPTICSRGLLKEKERVEEETLFSSILSHGFIGSSSNRSQNEIIEVGDVNLSNADESGGSVTPRNLFSSKFVPVFSSVYDNIELNAKVLDSRVDKSTASKELSRSKSGKLLLNGKVSSLFSKNKRLSREKTASPPDRVQPADLDYSGKRNGDFPVCTDNVEGPLKSYEELECEVVSVPPLSNDGAKEVTLSTKVMPASENSNQNQGKPRLISGLDAHCFEGSLLEELPEEEADMIEFDFIQGLVSRYQGEDKQVTSPGKNIRLEVDRVLRKEVAGSGGWEEGMSSEMQEIGKEARESLLEEHCEEGEQINEVKDVAASLLNSFAKKCPPGGEDAAVLYTTTLRGIRKTYKDCNAVQLAIESHDVQIVERDVSMDSGFREELRLLMGRREVRVPVLFVKGSLVGGAKEVLMLEEEGQLGPLLAGIPRAMARCDGCGGKRFVVCMECSGSSKVLDEENKKVKCCQCNENGLIRCPICC